MKKLITIEDAKSLDGYVVYAGKLLPFLWTHLVVYPDRKSARDAKNGNRKLRVVPVADVFHLESYRPFGEQKEVQRVASKPGIPREERLRK